MNPVQLAADIRAAYERIGQDEALARQTHDPQQRARLRQAIQAQWMQVMRSVLAYRRLSGGVPLPPDLARIAAEAEQTESQSLPERVKEVPQPPKYRGLIALVSRGRPDKTGQPNPAEAAILYHLPALPVDLTPSGIPSGLLRQLAETLKACDEFTTDRDLRAAFVDERLIPWYDRLPAADSIAERVQRVMDALHGEFSAARDNALVLLLRVLSERRSTEDAQHHTLAHLAGELAEHFRPSTPQTEPGGLEHCWLIASAGEKGSLPDAERLRRWYETADVHVYVRTVADALGVQETYDLVQHIYAVEVPQAGLTPDQVIADFTGGTKPMSAGLLLACGDRHPMQYLYGDRETIASVPRWIEFVAYEEAY